MPEYEAFAREREALMSPPTYEEFDILKEQLLAMAEEPDATVLGRSDGAGLEIELVRVVRDAFASERHPITVTVMGIMEFMPDGRTDLAIRYSECSLNPQTNIDEWSHSYRFTSRHNTLLDYGHRIGCFIVLPTLMRPGWYSPEFIREANLGRSILRRVTTEDPLTAGDCGVLHDRMLALMDGRLHDSDN